MAQGLAFLYLGGVQVPKRCKEGEMGEMDLAGETEDKSTHRTHTHNV